MKKTHVIMTYSGIHYPVTETQAEAAAMLKKDEERMMDGNLIKGANISDIIKIEKYYETFPNKRPAQTDMFQPLLAEPRVEPTSSVAGLRQIIRGVEKYIASTEQNPLKNCEGKKAWYKGGVEPLNLLDKLNKQLENKLNPQI